MIAIGTSILVELERNLFLSLAEAPINLVGGELYE